jgi:hypothetical protein
VVVFSVADLAALILVGDSGSGTKWAKMTYRKKNVKMYGFQGAGCSLLRTRSFSCRLDVLHLGLGINIYTNK